MIFLFAMAARGASFPAGNCFAGRLYTGWPSGRVFTSMTYGTTTASALKGEILCQP